MKVLITGGTGLLGKALLETVPEEVEAFATFHRAPPPVEWRHRFHPLELLDEPSLTAVMEAVRPDVIVHTASIGSVDRAEREPDAVRRINVGGVMAVGRAAQRAGAKLVCLSSNAVFDGARPPYSEEAPVRAVNRYGAFKLEAETWVRAHLQRPLILRPILMYGWPWPGGRDNAVTRWLGGLERGEAVEAARDIYSMPLYAGQCAQAIWAALRQRRAGIYHLAGGDRVSLAEFAQVVARTFGLNERLVIPVAGQSLAGLAPRPADTSFVTEKMERELGITPLGIHEGLTLMQRTRAFV